MFLFSQKSNEIELTLLWDGFVTINARCSEIEGQKQAKIQSKVVYYNMNSAICIWFSLLIINGYMYFQVSISNRIKERENERDLAEQELSSLNLSHIDERERNLVNIWVHYKLFLHNFSHSVRHLETIIHSMKQIEVERKTLALGEKDFESIINQKRTEIFSLEQKIRALYREKDVMASDSEDRVKLDLKKEELENYKKKQKKMYDLQTFLNFNFKTLFITFTNIMFHTFLVTFRMDEHKDKVRSVLKGRLPAEKDLKMEIVNAFG